MHRWLKAIYMQANLADTCNVYILTLIISLINK